MSEIPINIIYEDSLSGAVLKKLLEDSRRNYSIGFSRNAGGCGWIKKRIHGLNHSAKGMPYLVLIDLDRQECAPLLLKTLLDDKRHHNFILRVAVREVESWLLAHRSSFEEYLGVSNVITTSDVDGDIDNPKEYLIELVRKSKKRGT